MPFFHAKHHSYTGADADKDGVILFSSWYRPFSFLETTIVGRWLYTGFFGIFIFGFYLWNKKKELEQDCESLSADYRWEVVKATIVGLAQLLSGQILGWAFIHFTLWYFAGWQSVLYMCASAAFAVGAFGHPYIGFWLIQHQCCAANSTQFQPTVSYSESGSWLWHMLNLGELRHIEHHDFPTIPWYKIHKVHEIAPEYYRAPVIQKECPSIWGEVWKFISAKSNEKWLADNGDFGGRNRYLDFTTKVWPSRLD